MRRGGKGAWCKEKGREYGAHLDVHRALEREHLYLHIHELASKGALGILIWWPLVTAVGYFLDKGQRRARTLRRPVVRRKPGERCLRLQETGRVVLLDPPALVLPEEADACRVRGPQERLLGVVVGEVEVDARENSHLLVGDLLEAGTSEKSRELRARVVGLRRRVGRRNRLRGLG